MEHTVAASLSDPFSERDSCVPSFFPLLTTSIAPPRHSPPLFPLSFSLFLVPILSLCSSSSVACTRVCHLFPCCCSPPDGVGERGSDRASPCPSLGQENSAGGEQWHAAYMRSCASRAATLAFHGRHFSCRLVSVLLSSPPDSDSCRHQTRNEELDSRFTGSCMLQGKAL